MMVLWKKMKISYLQKVSSFDSIRYFEKFLSLKFEFFVHTMKVNGLQWFLFPNILQNILFCVLQKKKESHNGLEPQKCE